MTTAKLILPLALLTALLAAPLAAAHEHIHVGEHDEYELTIGWDNEPPIVDEPNGVWLRVMGPAPKVDSGMLQPGESYSFTFNTAGEVAYHCHPHPWMKGNITVEATHGHAHPETHHVEVLDGATNDAYRFSPENLAIHVGDTVVWHNNGTMPHHIMDDAVMHGHEGEDDHGHGHDAEGDDHPGKAIERVPIKGLEKSLKVEISIGGKSKSIDFDTVFRQDGVYIARLIPTVPGVYTVHITGEIEGTPVDVTTEIQRVEAAANLQFPESTKSAYEMQRELDRLGAEASAQAQTPATVEPQNDTPFVGLAALAVVVVGAALVARRRA